MANEEFRKYDHVDRDVIEINKDSLRLKIEKCVENSSAPVEARNLGGLAITLFLAGLVPETFRDLWVISGSTIQAGFLLGGVLVGFRALYYAQKWYRNREKYSPEQIVEELVRKPQPPIALLAAPQNKSIVRSPSRIRSGRSQISNHN